jgi:hypothetical protein
MNNTVQIIYRNEGGYLSAKTPARVISFLAGEVYFDDGAEEYRIPTEAMVCIIVNEE